VVSGTAVLAVTPSQGLTLVPGLTTVVNIPANTQAVISTYGGVANTSTSANGVTEAVIVLVIDGTPEIFQAVVPINNGGVTANFTNWSFTTSMPLSAGSHTIEIEAEGGNIGSNASVSGDDTSLLQGQLIVTVLGI
jgi:hypothetical protein